MRSQITLATLILATAALSSTACAPRVSKRAPNLHPGYQPAMIQPAPLTEQELQYAGNDAPETPVVAHDEPQVAAQQPAAESTETSGYIARRSATESAKPAPKADDDQPAGDTTDTVATKPAAKGTNFYAFSDSEITSMRKRSTDFRKLHDRLKVCTAKSERQIAKREQLREDIIRLQNEEYRTPKMEKQLVALRLEERKMKANKGQDTEDCSKIESRLTDMLRTTYGSGGNAQSGTVGYASRGAHH